MTDTCKWKYIEDAIAEYWETECGESWAFIDGTPEENRVRYCPYCGKKLEQIEPEVVEDE